MIIFEDGIKALIDRIESIDGFAPNFYWAKDANDVNAYLVLKDQPYPVIILQTGKDKSEVKGDGQYNEITRNAKFVLAVRELDASMLNNDRWESSYKNFLNPLLERFLEQLNFSSITRLPNGYSASRVPNYSDASKNAQIDLWDAVELECEIIMNNNCLIP